MRKPYDSDITREQFNQISLDLEFARKKTRPRKIDLYEVFCAISYLLKKIRWPHLSRPKREENKVENARTSYALLSFRQSIHLPGFYSLKPDVAVIHCKT
jgi:hypothetical protein